MRSISPVKSHEVQVLNNFVVRKNDLRVSIFEPQELMDNMPRMIDLRRERVKNVNTIHDMYGMCRIAIQQKNYGEAKKTYEKIVALYRNVPSDDKIEKKIKDLQNVLK